MKAITVKQPWASLIVHGIKDIENRTRPTKYRGRVLIHAGLSYDQARRDANQLSVVPLTIEQTEFVDGVVSVRSSSYSTEEFTRKSMFIKGAIIGSVEIIDCVINHESIWAEKTPTCAIGGCSKCSITGYCGETGNHLIEEPFKPIYNWVLANPILFEKPIENVKGKLSFWEFNETEQ